jgi:putative lipoic acid-binding regulatory protein
MAFELDLATDFERIVDWIKPVTVAGTEIETALRRAINTKEREASGGKYLSSDVVFHLDAAEQVTRPAIGSTIVDDDGTWTVLETAWQTLAKRWRCVCRQLSIDSSLTVTILEASFTKGTTGAMEPTFATVAEDVVAKVQLQTTDVDTSRTNRSTSTAAVVYFAEEQTLGPANRITTSDGKTLKVLSWDGFDQTEMLFRATCEISKAPHV